VSYLTYEKCPDCWHYLEYSKLWDVYFCDWCGWDEESDGYLTPKYFYS
jgi:hypothetical protein